MTTGLTKGAPEAEEAFLGTLWEKISPSRRAAAIRSLKKRSVHHDMISSPRSTATLSDAESKLHEELLTLRNAIPAIFKDLDVKSKAQLIGMVDGLVTGIPAGKPPAEWSDFIKGLNIVTDALVAQEAEGHGHSLTPAYSGKPSPAVSLKAALKACLAEAKVRADSAAALGREKAKLASIQAKFNKSSYTPLESKVFGMIMGASSWVMADVKSTEAIMRTVIEILDAFPPSDASHAAWLSWVESKGKLAITLYKASPISTNNYVSGPSSAENQITGTNLAEMTHFLKALHDEHQRLLSEDKQGSADRQLESYHDEVRKIAIDLRAADARIQEERRRAALSPPTVSTGPGLPAVTAPPAKVLLKPAPANLPTGEPRAVPVEHHPAASNARVSLSEGAKPGLSGVKVDPGSVNTGPQPLAKPTVVAPKPPQPVKRTVSIMPKPAPVIIPAKAPKQKTADIINDLKKSAEAGRKAAREARKLTQVDKEAKVAADKAARANARAHLMRHLATHVDDGLSNSEILGKKRIRNHMKRAGISEGTVEKKILVDLRRKLGNKGNKRGKAKARKG